MIKYLQIYEYVRVVYIFDYIDALSSLEHQFVRILIRYNHSLRYLGEIFLNSK